MKRNFMLSLTCLISLSLISCDGQEKKIDNATGTQLASSSINNTISNMQNIGKEGFLGFETGGKNSIKADISTHIIDNSFSKPINSYSLQASSELLLQGNVDVNGLIVKDIKDEPTSEQSITESSNSNSEENVNEKKIDLSNSELFGRAVVDYQLDTNFVNDGNILDTNVEKAYNKIEYYQKGNKSVLCESIGTYDENGTFTQNVRNPEYNTIDLELLNLYSPYINEIIDVLLGIDTRFEVEDFILDFGTTINNIDYFYSDRRTAEEIIEFYNTLFMVEKDSPEYNLLVDILNKSKECNPTNYIDYTQIKNKKDYTLNASFKYDSWKEKVLNSIENIYNTILDPVLKIEFSVIKPMVETFLPEKLLLSFSLNVNENDLISAYSIDLEVKGKAPLNILKDYICSMPDDNIEYDIKLSSNYSILFSNKILDINRINLEENNEQTN